MRSWDKLTPNEFACSECANRAGYRVPTYTLATYHQGRCEVCGQERVVTQKRDYTEAMHKWS